MKLLVWLLVLLNVGLLVYFNSDVIAPKPAVADQINSARKTENIKRKRFRSYAQKRSADGIARSRTSIG